jgi:anti-sigma B factor antagonist
VVVSLLVRREGEMRSELLRVHREQIGDQIVVHAVGEVDLATAPLLDQALSQATAAPSARWVVVNLTKVDFFGAVGLTVLLTATRHGHATGVPIVVVTHPGQPAHRTITITELHRTLALIDSFDHACAPEGSCPLPTRR